MDDPNPNPLIPLNEIIVECMECKSKATAQEVNNDVERYFSILHKSFVRFPEKGATKESAAKLASMRLICEICHEKEYG